jgi:hypothetical protein
MSAKDNRMSYEEEGTHSETQSSLSTRGLVWARHNNNMDFEILNKQGVRLRERRLPALG